MGSMVRVRGLSMELWKYPVLRDALAVRRCQRQTTRQSIAAVLFLPISICDTPERQPRSGRSPVAHLLRPPPHARPYPSPFGVDRSLLRAWLRTDCRRPVELSARRFDPPVLLDHRLLP